MSVFPFFELYDEGNQSNETILNMIFHRLLLSITFVPNFMIVTCSYPALTLHYLKNFGLTWNE